MKSFSSIEPSWTNNEETKKKKKFQDIKATDYDYGVDDNYINTFLEDSKNFILSSQDDYKNINYKTAESMYEAKKNKKADLGFRANTIKAFLNANKDNIDSSYSEGLTKYLDSFNRESDNISKFYRKAFDSFNSDEAKQTEFENTLNNARAPFENKQAIKNENDAAELATQMLNHAADSSVAIERLQNKKAGAERRNKDTTVYDLALKKLRGYANSGIEAYNSSVEDLQKQVDKPVTTMNDLDLTDENAVSRYLGNDREAVQFVTDYRKGKLAHSADNEQRFQNLVNTIEINLNTENEINSRYGNGKKIAYTDESGSKVNYGDLMRNKVAQNRISDITASSDQAKETLAQISKGGNRNILDSSPVDSNDLKNAGWSVSDGAKTNFTKAYSSEQHDTAAVFSPVVLNEDGSVKQILSPDELESYAEDILSGKGDKLNLRVSDIYYGAFAASLANENSNRISRLSERYYNDTDLKNLVDIASVEDNDSWKEAREKLSDYGVDWDEYKTYDKLIENKEESQKASKEYADWSTENFGTGTLATIANIATSPFQAFEYVQNLGENLVGYLKAGTNELSANLLPNIYNDTATNLSSASSQAISSSIKSSIKGNGDNEFLNKIGELAAQTYGGITSAVQSALTILTCNAFLPPGVAQAVGLSVLSGEAANGAYHDVIDNGGTVGQAITYSAAAGVNEALGEQLSIESLLNIKETLGKEKAKTLLINALKQSLAEGQEEVLTEGLNEFADRLINGDKSQYDRSVQQYMEQGFSEKEAKKKASLDFIVRLEWAAYGGAVGGGFSGGGKVLYNTAKLNLEDIAVGSQLNSKSNVNRLVDTALQMDNDVENATDLKALAQKIVDNNYKASNRQIGKLERMVQDANLSEIQGSGATIAKQTIKAELQSQGVAENDLEKATNAIYKKEFSGESLTYAEEKAIKTKAAQAAIQNVRNQSEDIATKAQTRQERYLKNFAETQSLTQKEANPTVDIEDLDISDDGKTYIKDTNEAVDIKNIAKISKDDIVVTLSSGKTESVKNLDLGNEDTAIAYQSILDMVKDSGIEITPSVANTIVDLQNASGIDNAAVYYKAATEVLENGWIGNTKYSLNTFAVELPENVRNEIYSLGRQLRQTYATNKTEALKNKKAPVKMGLTQLEGIPLRKLNVMQQSGVKVMQQFSKTTGLNITFFKSSKIDGKFVSRYGTANGFFDTDTNTIYIDVNAGLKGQGFILYTAAHELTHFIREWSPEHFKTFADFLVSEYNKNNVSVDELVREKQRTLRKELTYDQAYEEVIADSCESFLKDTDLIERSAELKNRDNTLWEKIKTYLSDLLDKVRALYSRFTPDSNEGKYVLTMRDSIQKIHEMWVNGALSAIENYNKAEIEENTESSEVKHSVRNDFGQQLEDWRKGNGKANGKYNGHYFDLGTTSKVFIKHGAKSSKVIMYEECLLKVAGGKHAISLDEISKLPYELEDPVLLFKGSIDNSFVALTEIKDKNGHEVIVAIHINRRNNRNVIQKIASLYSKTDEYGNNKIKQYINNQINAGNLIDASTKKAPNWFTSRGLQLPKLVQTIIDANNIISQTSENINSKTKNSERAEAETLDLFAQSKYKNALDIARGAIRLSEEEYEYIKEKGYTLTELNNELPYGISFVRNTEKSSKSISDVYDELSSLYPEYFEKSENSKQAIIDFVDSFKILRASTYNTAQKVSDAIDKEKQRYLKNIEKLKENFREQRKKNVEGRGKTALRNAIYKKIRTIDKMQNRSAKEKTVKQGLRNSVSELLEAAKLMFPDSISRRAMVEDGFKFETPTAEETQLLNEYKKLYEYEDKMKKQKTVSTATKEMIANKKKFFNSQLNDLFGRERKQYLETAEKENPALKSVLNELANSYRQMKNSEDGLIKEAYREEVDEALQMFIDENQNTLAINMSLKQLNDFNQIVAMILHTVRNANKTFANNLKATYSENGEQIAKEIKSIRKVKDKRSAIISKMGEMAYWNNLKPIYAFRAIGSKLLNTLYKNMQHGELVWFNDINEAKTFLEAMNKKYGVKKKLSKKEYTLKWNLKESYTFFDKNGKSFELNLNQIMDIYASSRRAQALQHLLAGGFVYQKDSKAKNGKVHTGATAYPLTLDIINEICSKLTQEQKSYVKEMQKFLSEVMGAKGNEVSMQLYGVKQFTEDTYWNISSSNLFTNTEEMDSKDAYVILKSLGFTKPTQKNASNPIVLQGFLENWSNHVNKMSLYHALTLPLEDFTKSFNFKLSNPTGQFETVRSIINAAYGSAAGNYIETFLKDVNGGVQETSRLGPADKLISLDKKSKVLLNLSVILQQPMAVIRAMAYVDPKYFGTAVFKGFALWNHNKDYEQLQKYAPIAGIKRMGSFDTGMGRGVVDYLIDGRMDNMLVKANNKIDDALGYLPNFADELAWVQLWHAVQKETKAKYGFKIGTEENLVKSGERFNEVVQLTQVYDSTFSRSQIMRSKNTFDKMVTSFMAEPTTVMNMFVDAPLQAYRKNISGAQLTKIWATTFVSILATAAMQSLSGVGRDDDDEDKYLTFGEKYLKKLGENLLDNIIPTNYFPFLRDIRSIWRGYDVDRMDMDLIESAINTSRRLMEKIGDGTASKSDWWKMLASLGDLSGKPITNLGREIKAAQNTYKTIHNSTFVKDKKDEWGINIAWKYQLAYDKAYEQGYSVQECEEKAESEARSYINKAVKDKYLEAYQENDHKTMNSIREYMWNSQYYRSTSGSDKGRVSLSAVDKVLDDWKKKDEELQEKQKEREEMIEQRKNDKKK